MDAVANSPRRGEDLCVSYRRAVLRASLQLYNVTGQRVAKVDEDSGNNPCVKTGDIAPSVYFLKSEATLDDGSRVEKMHKVLIRP